MNLGNTVAIIGVIFYFIYRKLKNVYTFWERKGVQGPKPLWLVGNVLSVLRKKESLNSLTKKVYDMYPNEKAVGIYLGVTPTLILKDLTLVRKVLIKDFASFAERGFESTDKLFSDSVVLEKGEKWKVYRQKLYPLFSTGRMKNTLANLEKHIHEYLNFIENSSAGPKELRMLDHKLSLKLLMSSSFGLKVDTLKEGIGNLEPGVYGIPEMNIRAIITTLLYGYNPDSTVALGAEYNFSNLKQIVEMIINMNRKARKDNPQQEPSTLFDFMEQGVVEKEKKDGVFKVEISDSVLAAHVAVLYASGLESFINSSFLLFELALNQQIQDRCYKEIVEVLKNYNGDLTFEAIEDLKYLNMAYNESLRKYPTGGYLSRKATKEYHFEDIDLTIEKDTKVIIPVQAIQKDPLYFPNPEVFDPERFSPENIKNIPDCSFLPFGDGPRKCIGYRQIRFQSILLIARILHRFKVTPCEKTVAKIRFAPYPFSMFVPDGLWVNMTKRQ